MWKKKLQKLVYQHFLILAIIVIIIMSVFISIFFAKVWKFFVI